MSFTATYIGSVDSPDDTSVTLSISTTENLDGSHTITGASGTWGGIAFSGLLTGFDGSDGDAFPASGTTNALGRVNGNGIGILAPCGPAIINDNGGVLSFSWFPGGAPRTGTLSLLSANIPCFLRGTRIGVQHGQVAVEDLAAGTPVRTLRGELLPIRWIGRRRHLRRPLAGASWQDVSPIRITRDAVGDGMPSRDLLVAPDHGLFLAGHLINARYLVNGTTIAHDTTLRDIEYFHIELERREVILAEDLPAATYLDNGNVAQWDNAADRPGESDGSAPAPQWAWYGPDAHGPSPVLRAVRAGINERAARRVRHAA